MSIARHHSEWLSLIEVSGPFLSMPVLMRVFPQGLENHDPEKFRTLRLAYEEWEGNNEAGPRTNPALHGAWTKFVLINVLGLPEEAILEQQAIPQPLQSSVPEHSEFLRPSHVVQDQGTHKPLLLIQSYPASQDLEKPVTGKTWKASPGTRMMELLHATGVRLGLVTNGERWMLVDAPKNETTGFASWYASIWLEEPITLRAFTSLLGAERFFNAPAFDTLEAMLAESASSQQEVTDQLGYQVRRAVEVLIQSLDRADQDHNRSLLGTIPEPQLYEAALTVMMRLVFLFSAEERGLLLLNDELYARNYAVSTLREQLRKTADDQGEEILERRHDAWCRLLSTFRAVFGGVKHDRMTLPAYGGHLFDPDRFPFLEGRKAGTTWRTCEADPLPVNNRTVLHLLEALQMLEVRMPGGDKAARRVSFRALDIEQIGHVYEGLLDHTAERATEPMLGLIGTRDREPEVSLSKLEDLRAKGGDKLIEFLREETGKSANALKNALKEQIDLHNANRFQSVSGGDRDLLKRIAPYAGLVRDDTFGYPVVITKGSIFVTAGTDRRSSGTHYTPRSLTEPIVQYTLEPLVYVGPAEGKPKEDWQLRTPRELLDLKICDMACGSGAFLVQACRYMSERLVEAWEIAERKLPKGTSGITPHGLPATGTSSESLIPKDAVERLAYARRIIAQRCLYGVDINPLAAEMAKLSLWLLTLAKDKPFTFLDHAIRCGDSLLGIQNLQQLKTFSLDGTGQQYVFGEVSLDKLVEEAITHRLAIESAPAETSFDLNAKACELQAHDHLVSFLKCAADLLVAAELKPGSERDKLGYRDDAAIQIGNLRQFDNRAHYEDTAAKALGGRRTFHWPLEFPEVLVERDGFDVFVGNPPFMGGKKITGTMSVPYRNYLVQHIAGGRSGVSDLCAYFFLRANTLLRPAGCFGLIATNTIAQGDTREVGLDQLLAGGSFIFRAVSSRSWPGTANLAVSEVCVNRGQWMGGYCLDAQAVPSITAMLSEPGRVTGQPHRLASLAGKSYQGSVVLGTGFILTPAQAATLIEKDKRNQDIIFSYLSGEDLNSRPDQSPSRRIINFFDWPLDRQSSPPGYTGPVAADYPLCLEIVREKVKPQRDQSKRKVYRERWWQYAERQNALYQSISHLDATLVIPETTKYCAFALHPTNVIFSHMTKVITFGTDEMFALLSSSIHESWVRQYASTLETRLKYTTSDVFETFPHPIEVRSLKPIGQRYRLWRGTIMERNAEGITDTYNRFHDLDVDDHGLQQLRDLHVEMDKAVAAAFRWDDLGKQLGHDFHPTKQGIRFTISETARREVLARLLKLNHELYAEELAQGLHEKGRRTKASRVEAVAEPSYADLSLFESLSYPATEADRAICAAFLSLLEQSGEISSVESLYTVMLVTHPDWCEAFLKPAERKRLTAELKAAPASLTLGTTAPLRWKEARDHLERIKAIRVDRSGVDQRLCGTPSLGTAKATFTDGVDGVVRLSLVAMKALRQVRDRAVPPTPEQSRLLAIFHERAVALGLAAA